MTTQKPVLRFSKKIFYALLATALLLGFLFLRRIILIILAPIGFLIYLIESANRIKQLAHWRSISNSERLKTIISLFTISVLAVLAAIICWVLISSKL